MFTIQYADASGESRMRELKTTSRSQLAWYLARFEHPILAVYEQATPITKAARKLLAEWPSRGLSRAARDFVSSPA